MRRERERRKERDNIQIYLYNKSESARCQRSARGKEKRSSWELNSRRGSLKKTLFFDRRDFLIRFYINIMITFIDIDIKKKNGKTMHAKGTKLN